MREPLERVMSRALVRLGGPRILALAVLRAMVLIAAFAWLAAAPTDLPEWRPVAWTLFAFLAYSIGVYHCLWFWRGATLRWNVLVMAVDLIFALNLIRLTGGAQSVFYLAFYLIAGLQSYYYGMRRGVLFVALASVGYLWVVWPTVIPGLWPDYAIRGAVLVLTAVGMGILSEVEDRERLAIASLNQELAVKEQRIRNVFDSIRDGIIVLDRERRIIGWNRAMVERYEIAEAEVLGRPLFEKFRNLVREGFQDALDQVYHGNRDEFRLERFEHQTRHRGLVTLNVKGSALRSPGGALEGVVLVLEDITAGLRMEQSMRQAEKLAALGTLSTGLAHELNNPIGIITSRIEIMLMEAVQEEPPETIKGDLEVLHRNAQRVAKIAQGLLSFARVSTGDKKPVDLNQVVEETLLLLEKALTKEGIVITRRLADDLAPILGDQNALQQVLLNLVTNAREALDGNGEITIETGFGSDRADSIRLAVTDTGRGIPADALQKIFDPFFTTKHSGTGLGLSVTYGIVKEHQGTIDVRSSPGQGTTFVLTFPALAAGASA